MPKELIVSVNGREKKIAIIENGRVTEFYIERGEASQGIVGNIYKGRVMRVLPGMQSAFVDIGLERDAFLYVSDFFDEEEEFERIVVDKTKTEGADPDTAARAAAERIERARLERERQMETAQERAEPVVEDETTDEPEEEEPRADEISYAPVSEVPVNVNVNVAARGETDDEEDGGRRGKRKRGRDGGRDRDRGATGGQRDTARGSTTERRAAAQADASQNRTGVSAVDVSTPFVASTDSFERVVDEDEAAFEDGSMFKDARVQERLLDQIRGVEFDMEDVPAVEVGALLSTSATASDNSFQRIADDDEPATSQTGARPAQQTVAVSVGNISDGFGEESATPTAVQTQTFQRISDDEQGTEAAGEPAEETPTRGRRGGRGASKRGSTRKTKGAPAPAGLLGAAAPGAVAGAGGEAHAEPEPAARGAHVES